MSKIDDIWKSRSLSKDLSLYNIVGTVAVAVTLIAIIYAFSTRKANEEFKRRADEYASAISESASSAVYHLNAELMESVALSYFNNERIVGISIKDDYGKMLFNKIEPGHPQVKTVSKPILFQQERIGEVQVTLTLEFVRENNIRILLSLIIVTALVISAQAFLILSLHQFFLKKPLNTLNNMAMDFAEGKPFKAVDSMRYREFLPTMNLFVDMKQKIDRQIEHVNVAEQKYRSIFENAVEGLFQTTKGGQYISVNNAMAAYFGYNNPEDMVNSVTDIGKQCYADPEDRRTLLEAMDKTAQISGAEIQYKRKDDSLFWGSISLRSVFDSRNRFTHYEGTLVDITKRKVAEEHLRASEKRYKDELEDMVKERTEELADSNAELQRMIEASDDRSNQAALLNEMGELLQACETEEETYRVAIGVCAKLFAGDSGCLGILDEDNWTINVVGSWGDNRSCSTEFSHNDCWAIRRGKAHIVLEPGTDPLCNHVRDTPKYGTLCVPMHAQGKVLGMAHMLFDNALKGFKESERRRIIHEKQLILGGLVERYAPSLVNLRLRESLREQSTRDRLTGLFNRRHMESALNCELARAKRRGTSLVLIMIDVDHFKQFNDTHGHETGYEVLRRLGGFITSMVRMEDIPCRYGGEELMLILPECSAEDGFARAKDIRRGIEEDVMVVHNGERLRVTASLGVASFPLDGEDVGNLVATADKALYRAKEGGRNRVVAHQHAKP